MVSCNNETYKRACEFFTIAELAQRIAIETYDFTAAFNANLAFSIELFLKSLSATPIEKVTLQVGSATLKTRFAKSAIKGHYLDEIFSNKKPLLIFFGSGFLMCKFSAVFITARR